MSLPLLEPPVTSMFHLIGSMSRGHRIKMAKPWGCLLPTVMAQLALPLLTSLWIPIISQ